MKLIIFSSVRSFLSTLINERLAARRDYIVHRGVINSLFDMILELYLYD